MNNLNNSFRPQQHQQRQQQRRFHIRGKWELILVFFVVLAGIVVTTIALLNAKDKQSSSYTNNEINHAAVINSNSPRLITGDSFIHQGVQFQRNNNEKRNSVDDTVHNRTFNQNRYQVEQGFGDLLEQQHDSIHTSQSRHVTVKFVPSSSPPTPRRFNDSNSSVSTSTKTLPVLVANIDRLPLPANNSGSIVADSTSPLDVSASENQPKNVPKQSVNSVSGVMRHESHELKTNAHTPHQSTESNRIRSKEPNLASIRQQIEMLRMLGIDTSSYMTPGRVGMWLQEPKTKPNLLLPSTSSNIYHRRLRRQIYADDAKHHKRVHRTAIFNVQPQVEYALESRQQQHHHVASNTDRMKHQTEDDDNDDHHQHHHQLQHDDESTQQNQPDYAEEEEEEDEPNDGEEEEQQEMVMVTEKLPPPPPSPTKSDKSKRKTTKKAAYNNHNHNNNHHKKNKYYNEESKKVEKYDILGSGNFEIIRGGILDKMPEEKTKSRKKSSNYKTKNDATENGGNGNGNAQRRQHQAASPVTNTGQGNIDYSNENNDLTGDQELQQERPTKEQEEENESDNFEPFNFDLFGSDPILQGFQGYDNFDATKKEETKVKP